MGAHTNMPRMLETHGAPATRNPSPGHPPPSHLQVFQLRLVVLPQHAALCSRPHQQLLRASQLLPRSRQLLTQLLFCLVQLLGCRRLCCRARGSRLRSRSCRLGRSRLPLVLQLLGVPCCCFCRRCLGCRQLLPLGCHLSQQLLPLCLVLLSQALCRRRAGLQLSQQLLLVRLLGRKRCLLLRQLPGALRLQRLPLPLRQGDTKGRGW